MRGRKSGKMRKDKKVEKNVMERMGKIKNRRRNEIKLRRKEKKKTEMGD